MVLNTKRNSYFSFVAFNSGHYDKVPLYVTYMIDLIKFSPNELGTTYMSHLISTYDSKSRKGSNKGLKMVNFVPIDLERERERDRKPCLRGQCSFLLLSNVI